MALNQNEFNNSLLEQKRSKSSRRSFSMKFSGFTPVVHFRIIERMRQRSKVYNENH